MIFVGIPTHDGRTDVVGLSALQHSMSERGDVWWLSTGSSLLNFNCNRLFCDALNNRHKGVTHFLLMHSDIRPENGFITKMMDILTSRELDCLSVVMPIKDEDGLTSTSMIVKTGENTARRERLTMKQVKQLPPTFRYVECAEMIGESPDNVVMVANTGLMLLDLSKSWIEKLIFATNEKIVKIDGKFYAHSEPEDWFFTRSLHQMGGRLAVTRAVNAQHMGLKAWSNQDVWGSDTDEKSLGLLLAPK